MIMMILPNKPNVFNDTFVLGIYNLYAEHNIILLLFALLFIYLNICISIIVFEFVYNIFIGNNLLNLYSAFLDTQTLYSEGGTSLTTNV